ncbi:MAG TPA: iron-sulfur cluster assembly scaffold protein [Bdellovibrio sp.]|uniref:iron-sulfur cluster assembly scaffold protein n=1 Tax=Bdellovibrio sp. TaxID=28201 RepID=UPI002EF67421
MNPVREQILKASVDKSFHGKIHPVHLSALEQNRFCGDEIQVYFQINNGLIENLSAEVRGCLIVHASWNLLAGSLRGKTLREGHLLCRDLLLHLKEQNSSTALQNTLSVLEAYRAPHARNSCASLPAMAALKALRDLSQSPL